MAMNKYVVVTNNKKNLPLLLFLNVSTLITKLFKDTINQSKEKNTFCPFYFFVPIQAERCIN